MEPIIGIDFGTTNSAVSFFDGQHPRVLLGDDGEALMPSAVFIGDDRHPHVGFAARNVVLLYPENTILSVKRAIGSTKRFLIGGRDYSPQEIASYIFRELRERAEKRLGQEVRKAVVSVPAYFDELKRQEIKEAASMAGIEAVRLINEPTAAALSHPVLGTGNTLVYDLGGGTFDVSVVQAADGVYRVLSSRGDAHLGGNDFDRELMREMMESFQEETGIDLADDRLAMHKLRIEAERAKIQLTTAEAAHVEIPFIAANVHGACNLEADVTREQFEQRIRGHIGRTIRLCRGALTDAGLSAEEIEHVVLIGGSTRIPAVRSAVERLMGRPATEGVDPERAVAEGAAREAGIIAGSSKGTILVDVTPLGLGIESGDSEFVTLLPRNSVLPARSSAIFTTVSDFQRRARITVLQGEHKSASENVRLGSFELPEIEQARRGEPEIEVSFLIDVDGLLQVTAADRKTGSRQGVTLCAGNETDRETSNEIVQSAREAEIDELFFGGGAR